MHSAKRSGVFLSYARADGEAFAETVSTRLHTQAPDIIIKRDRLLLEAGVGWWKQLTEAIDSVEFLILLMTPAAMQSPTVAKEWRYARQQGVCVYPVKAAPDSELHFDKLPRWMSKAHFFDLEKEWETFIAHLRKGCDTPRVPFMAPDLPENFIQRPDEFTRLKDLLLWGARPRPQADPPVGLSHTPIAITTALSGAGGFGKTTLAAALCHDEDIIQNFDDGILWVTLGQNPDVLGSLVTVYAALTGERPGFASIEDAAFQLGQKLEDRTCLLVIDDVWDDAHLGPFLRGGKQSARLFTTRNAEIAADKAQPVNVDEMRESESLALLTQGIPELTDERAQELSHRLGEWPLALEIARAMMRQRIAQGDSADHAAQRLLQVLDKKGPRGLARGTGDPRHRTIDSVVQTSLELLAADDRRRLAELSIFPEDIAIPLTAASALWGLDDSEELALRFAQLYLLKFDLAHGLMRLHDVMRTWLASQITNAAELHNHLLDAWPDWNDLPDAYAWRWLPWHLAQVGRTADLARTLQDPAWLQAKLARTNVHALMTDFDLLNPKGEAELIQIAIRLSSHILAKDPDQFVSQIFGRLLIHNDKPAIQQFTESLAHSAHHPWFRCLWPSLDAPGTALIRTFAGHTNLIAAVAITPDGRRAISASFDKTLKLWDLETGAELHTFTGHSNAVTAVAITRGGRCAVSLSFDKTLKLWDLERGAELRTFTGHSDLVKAVAITPDGRRAVSGSEDNTLKLWDLETGAELRMFTGHSDRVTAVAITPDRGRAVSGSWDNTLKLWDLETGAELRTFTRHFQGVTAVAITPDGRRAVSASWENTLKLWDLDTGAELRTFTGHSGSVSAIALTPDGRHAISASNDKTLKLWELETGAELRTFTGHGGPVGAVAITPDGHRAISASWDNTLKLWDLEAGSSVQALARHSAAVLAVAVDSDKCRAMSASEDGTLKAWDLESGAELRTFTGPFGPPPEKIAITPDVRRAVSVFFFDNTLKLWDLETGAELLTLTGHSDLVIAVAITPDARRALSASRDRTLKLWDLGTGAELRTFTRHPQAVTAVAITPDGRRAVSASYDETLTLWDLETGAELRTLTGYSDPVTALAITPDARRAVAALDDKTLKLWDVETGFCLAKFICDAVPSCCAFVDDTTLLAGDKAGRLDNLGLEFPSDKSSK